MTEIYWPLGNTGKINFSTIVKYAGVKPSVIYYMRVWGFWVSCLTIFCDFDALEESLSLFQSYLRRLYRFCVGVLRVFLFAGRIFVVVRFAIFFSFARMLKLNLLLTKGHLAVLLLVYCFVTTRFEVVFPAQFLCAAVAVPKAALVLSLRNEDLPSSSVLRYRHLRRC